MQQKNVTVNYREYESIEELPLPDKSLLQEEIQKEKGNSLSYEEIGEYGPDHDKTFKFVVKLNGAVVGTGEGRSKKEAEQAAAGNALLKIQK